MIYVRSALVVTAAALVVFLTVPFGSRAQSCSGTPNPDWMDTGNPLDARVKPADCSVVLQTPPDFGWPATHSGAAYELTVTHPNGSTRTVLTASNWYNWEQALPAGDYTWQVRRIVGSNRTASRARRFTVGADAQTFIAPDPLSVLSKASAKPHPRGMPGGAEHYSMLMSRIPAVSALMIDVYGRGRDQPQPEPRGSHRGNNESEAIDEVKRTWNALVTYGYTGNDWYYGEALRRVMNLANWDPRGATSYAQMDTTARTIAWTVALGYDWLHPRLTAEQKNRMLATLRVRVGDMYDDLIGGNWRIAKYPRDSHANQALVFLAVISTLLAGDVPEASLWLQHSLPTAINAISPWGGEDGGFANSATQGLWDVGEQLLPWYVLRWATGVDLSKKPWVANWSKFMAYFMPPGTPALVFGDGLEMNTAENRARFAKGYANFAPSPLARWYAGALAGHDATRIEYVMSPQGDGGAAPFPAGTPSSWHAASIGWVAMHSDLQDPNRTSVYFKSSPPPFGAFNHSHADQNSFVINSGGQRLALESGYYDGYKTPHWWNWYKQTRAKNAITFDGGHGQLFYERDERAGTGGISWWESRAGYDIVMGEAGSAYGIARAMRSMVYLRPNLILVYDVLRSYEPRTWEWNIHAANAIEERSNAAITIANGGRRLCVDMLVGPAVRFSQTSEWTSPPNQGAAQWHGRFSTTVPMGSADFIALLRVGCENAPASVNKEGPVWTIQLPTHTVRFADDRATTVTPR